MAAFFKHGSGISRFFATNHSTVRYGSTRSRTLKAEKTKRIGIDRKVGPRIDSSAQSLAAKGFLRQQTEYSPPKNLTTRLTPIIEKFLSADIDKSAPIEDSNIRFSLFNACCNEFNHSIPNSLLYSISTVEDLIEFYMTPVGTITPYDNFRNMDLPKNLHIQYEYHRFHPDSDTKFDGITAFPRSSTIVSGLKYRKKYKGHEQREEWPFSQ